MLDSVSLMPPDAPLHFWAIMMATFGFWLVAYVLIIRTSYRKRTFGMPVAALCCNMGWEILLSTYFASEYLLIHLGNVLWLLFDVGILIAVLRFGRDDFADRPLIARYLPWYVAAGVVMAVLIQGVFMVEFDDGKGFVTGWACALVMSILFVAMHARRKNLDGQSPAIAMSMLFGNVCALLWVMTEPGAPPVKATTYCLLFATLSINAFYAGLTVRARRTERAVVGHGETARGVRIPHPAAAG
jgi:hypothetical protein